MRTPERERETPLVEHGEDFEVPEHLEQELEPVTSKFQQTVTDDKGEPLIESEDTREVKIEIPAVDREETEKIAKGPTEDSRTWKYATHLRQIAKAVYRGVKVVFTGKRE